jgi:flagellin
MLGLTVNAQQKSTEKLSSGYKINRAADDAAGLAISEKMRSQIRGLDRASTNAQDGVSVVQTAEGALNEVHSMLQRMNELATQAANDTNTTEDRSQIQREVDQLTSEIDRVSSTTQFNTMNLLDGSFQNKRLQVGSLSGQNITLSIEAMDAASLGLGGSIGDVKAFDKDDKPTTDTAAPAGTKGVKAKNGKIYSVKTDTDSTVKNPSADKYAITQDTSTGFYLLNTVDDKGEVTKGKAYAKSGNTYYEVNATALSPAGAGNTLKVSGGLSVDSYENAGNAMDTIQKAITQVSTQRAELGAVQNRLEHTIANLDNVSENTQSAESRIRDTDMAKEMVSWSKNNILQQAGQSMLAQANQSNQGVLSLLQ